MICLVASRQVFQTNEILAAVENAQRCGVHLGNGEMKM